MDDPVDLAQASKVEPLGQPLAVRRCLASIGKWLRATASNPSVPPSVRREASTLADEARTALAAQAQRSTGEASVTDKTNEVGEPSAPTLREALTWRELYKRMREVAARYSNHCDDTGSTRRLERLFSQIEDDERRIAADQGAATPQPPPCATVVQAIRAVDAEARRRGSMFPQTSDEQGVDRKAVRRVVEMLEWYDKNTGCHRIEGWPGATPQPAEPDLIEKIARQWDGCMYEMAEESVDIGAVIRRAAGAQPAEPATIRVCPIRDIECGRRPENWCDECPKHGAAGAQPAEQPRQPESADGGVLEGWNRTTSGAIGQP